MHHTHGAGVFIVIVLAIVWSSNIIVRTWSARHPNNPMARALAVAV